MKRLTCLEIQAYIRSIEREPHHRFRSRQAPGAYDLCEQTFNRRPVLIDPRKLRVEPHSDRDVQRYARRIAAGEKPPPVVLIDRKFWYEIVDGAHRIAAARAAGLHRIPAFVGRRRR
jgi:hypothetical protein